jgi:transcription elongation factor Elf1
MGRAREKPKAKKKMRNLLAKKIEVVRKKLNCDYGSCGQQFVFEITAEKLAIVKHNAQYRYQGKCKQCGKILKLSASGMHALKVGFGEYKLIVHETKYNDLFE